MSIRYQKIKKIFNIYFVVTDQLEGTLTEILNWIEDSGQIDISEAFFEKEIVTPEMEDDTSKKYILNLKTLQLYESNEEFTIKGRELTKHKRLKSNIYKYPLFI
jgi:hypothetical protein